jgi:hypothetical protein
MATIKEMKSDAMNQGFMFLIKLINYLLIPTRFSHDP